MIEVNASPQVVASVRANVTSSTTKGNTSNMMENSYSSLINSFRPISSNEYTSKSIGRFASSPEISRFLSMEAPKLMSRAYERAVFQDPYEQLKMDFDQLTSES